ncbi:hypothetical protein LINPERPRIM_LOCUS14524 [Linum perenne]
MATELLNTKLAATAAILENWGRRKDQGEDGSWIVSPMVEGLEHLVVNDLIVPGMPEWDEGLLGDLFSARDIESILFMTPPASNEKDRIIWGLSRDGRYTVRSAYRLATDSLRPTPLETVEGDWNRIWRLEMAPKIKHLIWRLARHRASDTQQKHFGGVLWSLSKERNERVWQQGSKPEDLVVRMGIDAMEEWAALQHVRGMDRLHGAGAALRSHDGTLLGFKQELTEEPHQQENARQMICL